MGIFWWISITINQRFQNCHSLLVEYLRADWKIIDIFYGYGNLCVRIYISDPSPINFNKGWGCSMARIQISKDPSGRIIVSFPYDPIFISKVKTVKRRRRHPIEKHWSFHKLDLGECEKYRKDKKCVRQFESEARWWGMRRERR